MVRINQIGGPSRESVAHRDSLLSLAHRVVKSSQANYFYWVSCPIMMRQGHTIEKVVFILRPSESGRFHGSRGRREDHFGIE